VRLLDLFCGAGGAAMGYSRAGFDEIVGLDNRPQPRYPFEFVLGDALEYVAAHGHEFDAIHASPPCQFYSRLRYLPWLKEKVYWRSIPPTREALLKVARPWVIENVEDAAWDMREPHILCGKQLGLSLYRHRCFELHGFDMLLAPPHQKHSEVIAAGRATLSERRHGLNGWGGVAGHQGGHERHKAQMGIDWMTGAELSQAVPPVFTEYVGGYLRRAAMEAEA